MTKNKYGNRYQCFKCGCKFYDLNNPKAICPKCGADQASAPKREKSAHAAVHKPPVIPIPEEELSEEIVTDIEEGEEGFGLPEEEFPLEINENEEEL